MAKKRIALAAGGDTKVIAEAAACLAGGGVAVFPTETVYGIGVAAGDVAALERLRRLKGRDADKPFQHLVADMAMARDLGAVFGPGAGRLAEKLWPGPLTLVVPDGTAPGETVGIRVPDSPFALALARALGRAIVTSSANPAGQPPPKDAHAADAFGDDVDLLVDGGGISDGLASTVVRCLGDTYEILRHGALDDEAIRAAWEQ